MPDQPESHLSELRAIERRLHALIRAKAAELNICELPPLPVLDPDAASGGKTWFPVPGMYGGFSYDFDGQAGRLTLVVDSWSRVIDGSEQRHLVTSDGVALAGNGFM